MTDTLTPKQLDAMFAAVDDADLAREDRRLRADRRRDLIVDYLLAAEESPKGTKALTDARKALAAFLVVDGEYPTVEAAADAIAARRVRSMPQPGTDYSKVVPF